MSLISTQTNCQIKYRVKEFSSKNNMSNLQRVSWTIATYLQQPNLHYKFFEQTYKYIPTSLQH